jgi:hypothetical protein
MLRSTHTKICTHKRAYACARARSPIAEARTCELIANYAGECRAKHSAADSVLEQATSVQVDGVYACAS